MTLSDAALAYARLGWPVLPLYEPSGRGRCACRKEACPSPGKHPRTPRGVKDATTDAETIRAWWRQWSSASVGVATGRASGLVALDVDPGRGGDDSLRQLVESYGPLPTTLAQRTGGGGRHVLFAHPGNGGVPNPGDAGGWPGLDVRGDGGYIVAAPSRHATGGLYEWETDPATTPLASLPSWLLDLFTLASRNGDSRTWSISDRIPEGERNSVLTSLAGTMRRRGMSEEAILAALLVENAGRCDPPLSEGEVGSIARSVSRYEPAPELSSSPSFTSSPAASSLGVTPPWAALAPEALTGLAGDIVRTIDPYTEADPVAVLVHVLVAFGNIAGPGPHFKVEETRHPARLFAVLAGETAKARKGTAWSTPRRLFSMVEAGWAKDCVTAGLSSGEGLINAIRDPKTEVRALGRPSEKVEEYQDVMVDRGVPDKRLLVVEEEFAQALKVMTREGNILSVTIRQAWDSGDLRPLTKTNPIRATGGHISIIGHITRDELLRHLTQTEQANGFANRFLWVVVRRSKVIPKPTGVPEPVLAQLVAQLSEAVTFARDLGDREIERDAEAEALWTRVYPVLSEGQPGLRGAILARAEVQVMRLALAYCLLDRVAVIRREYLEAGLALWRYTEASAGWIFGSGLGNPLADRILQALRAEGELDETAISSLFGRNRPKAQIGPALALLRQKGLAVADSQPTGGRPRTVWRPTS